METIGAPQPSFAYWGDHPEWLIAYSQHRDSDVLTRSNFRSIRRELESLDAENVAVESCSHWLVGWVEYLLVAPGSRCEARANEIHAQLEDYPVADEEDFSELETEEAIETGAEYLRYEYPGT